VNSTPCPLRSESNLGLRAPFHRKLDFASQNERKARCILTRALGGLCRSGSFARVKMMRKQVHQLKRLLAEKTMEVDFFKGALQKIEARRQKHGGSGETASTSKSAK
jgi:hypothetical protein